MRPRGYEFGAVCTRERIEPEDFAHGRDLYHAPRISLSQGRTVELGEFR